MFNAVSALLNPSRCNLRSNDKASVALTMSLFCHNHWKTEGQCGGSENWKQKAKS